MTTTRSESLQVFLRIRPPLAKELNSPIAVTAKGPQVISLSSEKHELQCSYDYIFDELSEQSQVFEKIKPLLVDVLSGVNSCIFAYGQTSAGKSYTMIGPNGGQDIFRRDPNMEWGILPRASEFLLSYLNDKSEEGLLSYEVKASFLQIYNENLYDLLRDSPPIGGVSDKMDDRQSGSMYDKNRDGELRIREVSRSKGKSSGLINEVFVSGLSEFRVQTSEDILRILAVGTNNRMTRSTDFNNTSSRSHALLQLTFEIETQTEMGQTIINRSKLNLVDLAGSEKISLNSSSSSSSELTSSTKHIKELTSINKSLSSLGNVIAALSSSNRTHIPYRDSKLTRILQDSLSGNTRTILIACVAPTVMHVSESMSTLQFADRAKSVMLSVKANTLVDDKFLLTKAHGEINRLKGLLAQALKQNEGHLKQPIDSSGITIADYQQLQDENENLKKDLMLLKSLVDSRASNHHGSVDNDQYINGYNNNHHHHDSIVNQSNRYEQLNNLNTNNNTIITSSKSLSSSSSSASALVVGHNINPLLSQYSSSKALVHNSSNIMIGNNNSSNGSGINNHPSIASNTNTSIDRSYHHPSLLPSITSIHPTSSVPSLPSSSFSSSDNNSILNSQQVKSGNHQKAKPPQVGKNFWDLERFSYFDNEKDGKLASMKKKKKTKKGTGLSSADQQHQLPPISAHDQIYRDINHKQIEELNNILSNANNQVQQQQSQPQQQSHHTLMQYLQQQQYMQQNHPSLALSTTTTDQASADTLPQQHLTYSKTSNAIATTHNPNPSSSSNIIITNMGSSSNVSISKLPPQKIQHNSIMSDSLQSLNYQPSQQTGAMKSSPYTIVKLGQGNTDFSHGSDSNSYGPPPSSYTNYPTSNNIHNQHSPANDVSNINDHSSSSIMSIPNIHGNQLTYGGEGGRGGAYYNTSTDIIQMNPINMPTYNLSNSGHFMNSSTGAVSHNSNGNNINGAYTSSNGANNNPQQQQQQQQQYPHEDPLSTVVYHGASNGNAAAATAATASSNKHTTTTHILLPKINTNSNSKISSHSNNITEYNLHSDSNNSIDRGGDGNNHHHNHHVSSTNAPSTFTTHSGITSNRSSVVVTKASLSNSKDDIGRSLQLFSFRSNAWEHIELIDYEPSKHLHKCLHVDGTIQWIDLTKKPVREET